MIARPAVNLKPAEIFQTYPVNFYSHLFSCVSGHGRPSASFCFSRANGKYLRGSKGILLKIGFPHPHPPFSNSRTPRFGCNSRPATCSADFKNRLLIPAAGVHACLETRVLSGTARAVQPFHYITRVRSSSSIRSPQELKIKAKCQASDCCCINT